MHFHFLIFLSWISLSWTIAAAAAESISCDNAQRIHVAQANNVDIYGNVSMTVSFSLHYDRCKNVQPLVLYGPVNDDDQKHNFNLAMADKPLQFQYQSSKSDGIFQSDWIYHVELANVTAGLNHYWYQILILEANEALDQKSYAARVARSLRASASRVLGQSKTYTFITPPLPGQPTTLAFVGDLGQTENSRRTILSMAQTPDLSQIFIAGDMSYANSEPNRWNSWFDLICDPLASSVPLHVAAGNHEIECDEQNYDIFVPYENYFRNPNRIGSAVMEPVDEHYRKRLWNRSCSTPSSFQGVYDYGNSFYSFIHGLVHVIVLNSYTDATEGSPQYKWLETELSQQFNRTQTPWLVVSFHAPLYTTFCGHVNEIPALRMKAAMEPLFRQFGVNLIINGHDHAYMRTHPLYKGKIDPLAPIYLTLGAGGNREGHSKGYRNDETQETWVARRTLQDYGFGKLTVVNATHARFRWVRDKTTDQFFEDIVWFHNPY
jgi:hypothetical protein